MFKPMVLFLSETKMSAQRSQELRWRLGYPNAFGVSCSGLSGDLVMMWKNEISLDIKSFSKYHIDGWVSASSSVPETWRFTGFYGDPECGCRKESWRMLWFLRNENALPWLCAGDFNEVLYDHEQFRGNDRGEWMMEGFCEVFSYARFADLGFSGLPYTWDNRWEGRNNVKVRLDRALADERMLDLAGDTAVEHVQMA